MRISLFICTTAILFSAPLAQADGERGDRDERRDAPRRATTHPADRRFEIMRHAPARAAAARDREKAAQQKVKGDEPRAAARDRQPVPAKANLERARSLLVELYGDRLTDRSVPAQRKLAEAMLAQAGKSDNSPADRYVLLEAAIEAAKKAQAPALAFSAIDRLAEAFEVDGEAMKAELIESSPARVSDDPAANSATGRHLAFGRGDWKRALPLLAQGSDKTLRELAGRELAGVEDADGRWALARAWWEVAAKEAGPAQARIRLHAAEWYRSALPELTGLAKAVAEKRLAEAEESARKAGLSRREGPDRSIKVGAENPRRDADAAAMDVVLLLVNDDDGRRVDLFVNGKEIDEGGFWRSKSHRIELKIKPTDIVVARTSDGGKGELTFALIGPDGKVLSYSRPNIPVHGEGDGLAEFLAGKHGAAAKAARGHSGKSLVKAMDTRTWSGMSAEDPLPKEMPDDWSSIWFEDPTKTPIHVRIFPAS